MVPGEAVSSSVGVRPFLASLGASLRDGYLWLEEKPTVVILAAA